MPTNQDVNKKYGADLHTFWDSHGEVKFHSWYAYHSINEKDVLRESKIYGFSDYIAERYEKAQISFVAQISRKLRSKYFWNSLISLIDGIVFIGIQAWLISNFFSGTISVGIYTFYLTNIRTVASAFNEIQSNLSVIFEHIHYIQDFKTYLELPSIIKENENTVIVENTPPTIEFKNVYFKYPDKERYILKNVSFKINAGEKISLVGENGAGKTTIIKLLARFYDVTYGAILINGHDIKNIDRESYYSLWGVLFQDFAKLWFTVRENIGIGNLDKINNMELIKKAATRANADEFIEELPQKYESMASVDFKDGIYPSGGQWQKLGIARALFADPKFIVLDEPTSNLDALAESEVFEQIQTLASDTTMLIVSHRFATVRNASNIIVLSKGEIKEIGNHEELIRKDGLYAKMYNKQAEGYK